MAASKKSGHGAAKPLRPRAAKSEKTVKGPTAKKTAKKTAKTTQKKTETEAAEKAAERFVEDLLIRGEAVYPDERGGLPPGATHEIVAEPGEGKAPKVKRRRFSMY